MKLTTERLRRDRTGGHDADQTAIPEDAVYWREYLGEYLDEAGVQKLLGIENSRVLMKRVAANEILAIPTTRGMAFPKFQFVGGQVDPTISQVVKIFSGAVATPYTTASWLRGARFENKSITEWIESGENPEIVIQAAEESAARLAA